MSDPNQPFTLLQPTPSACAIEVLDFLVVSIYISPNSTLLQYDSFLTELESIIAASSKTRLLIAGDFNAAHPSWYNNRPCPKGDLLSNWIIQHDLVLANTPASTYIGPYSASTIDLTLVSDRLISRLGSWRAWDNQVSLSDHLYITFELSSLVDLPVPRQQSFAPRVNIPKLEKIFSRRTAQPLHPTPENVSIFIENACKKASPRRPHRSALRTPKYWWNSEIADSRRDCLKARRRYVRSRTHSSTHDQEVLRMEYHRCMASLRKSITKSKSDAWKKLLEDLNDGQHPFGKAYKIVTGKFTRPLPSLDLHEANLVISDLFPIRADPLPPNFAENENFPFDPVGKPEREYVLSRLKPRKAPGIDSVPGEAVELLIRKFPTAFDDMMNRIFATGIWPDAWKTARLVLVPKAGSSTGSSAFRPISCLASISKAAEHVLHHRLVLELERNKVLSENQHGFRAERSTSQAISKVLDIAQTQLRKPLPTRQHCLAVLLDVKNAFNTLSWNAINTSLEEGDISPYLRRILASYLSNRRNRHAEETTSVSAGVPQGSILGPTLWNVGYDGVLRLPFPPQVTPIAFADDLALVITHADPFIPQTRTNHSLAIIDHWMQSRGLSMSPTKSVAIFLNGRKRSPHITVTLNGCPIPIKPTARYLGYILDSSLTSKPHLIRATAKAQKMAMALSRILPRSRGATDSRRRVLSAVVDSVLLYAAPIWGHTTSRD